MRKLIFSLLLLSLPPFPSLAATGFGTRAGQDSLEGFTRKLGFDSNGGFSVAPAWLGGPVPGPTMIDVDEIGTESAGIEEALLATCPTDPGDPAGVVMMPVGTTVTIDMTLDNAVALLDPNIDVPNLANCEINLTDAVITWLYTQEDADNVAGDNPQLIFIKQDTWTNVNWVGGTHLFENTCKAAFANGLTQPFGDDKCFGGNIRALEDVDSTDVTMTGVRMVGPFVGKSPSSDQWRTLIYSTGATRPVITQSTFEVGNSGLMFNESTGLEFTNNTLKVPDTSVYGAFGDFFFDGANDTAFVNHPQRFLAIGGGSDPHVAHNTFDGDWGQDNITADIGYVSGIFRSTLVQIGFSDIPATALLPVNDGLFEFNTMLGLTRNGSAVRFMYLRSVVDSTIENNTYTLDALTVTVGIATFAEMAITNTVATVPINVGNTIAFNRVEDVPNRGINCPFINRIMTSGGTFFATSNQDNVFTGNTGLVPDSNSLFCGTNGEGGSGGTEDGVSYVRNRFTGANGTDAFPIDPVPTIKWGVGERALNGLTTTPRTMIPYYLNGGTHESISGDQDEVLNHNSDLVGTPAVDGENWTLISRGGLTELKYCPPAANTIIHDGASAGECIVSTGTGSTISLEVEGTNIVVKSGGAGWSQETP